MTFHPTLGRLLQEDPIGFGAGDANQYRFTDNNPVTRVDPLGLFSVTPQSVGEGPVTGFDPNNNNQFAAYWGVGLYLGDDSWKQLVQAGGGYIVTHRIISYEFEDCDPNYEGSKSGRIEAWFLDPINFNNGKPIVHDKYGGRPWGGPRPMTDGDKTVIAAAYLSLLNTNAGCACKKGRITVSASYSVYLGAAGDAINQLFPGSNRPKPIFIKPTHPDGLPGGLGYDEYAHKPWTATDPTGELPAEPIATGSFDAWVTWNNGDQCFQVCNTTDISGGPQRPGGRPPAFVDPWVYDPDMGQWIQKQ